VVTAHASNPDYGFGKGVTGGTKATAQYMPGHKGKTGCSKRRFFQKIASGIVLVHADDVLNRILKGSHFNHNLFRQVCSMQLFSGEGKKKSCCWQDFIIKRFFTGMNIQDHRS
jgi:hypothetical protein